MAKLTRAQRKAHAEAERILSKDRLTEDEREFVFNNWHEGADFNNAHAGAFLSKDRLTEDEREFDLSLCTSQYRIFHLCKRTGHKHKSDD